MAPKEIMQENTKRLEKMSELIQAQCPLAKQVRHSCTEYYPEVCFITVDALNAWDYPHGIQENSIYLQFRIDFKGGSYECTNCGHVYLSPTDLKTTKWKYLCMRDIKGLAEERKGVKKMRKSKYKDVAATAQKIATYFNKVMEAVTEYTGGYPYKQGI